MIDIEKEKRKGLPQPHNPWLYAVGGFMAAILFAAVGIYLYDWPGNQLNVNAQSLAGILFTFSMIFLILVGLAVVGAHFLSVSRHVASETGEITVIQELVQGVWEDRLILTPIVIDKPAPEPEKDKSLPRRPSLFWMVAAALVTSLYGVFLSRPTQEKR